MNEAAALPSPAVPLSARLNRDYGRLRRPPGTPPTSRLDPGYRTGRSDRITPQHRRAGEGLPSSRRHLPNVQHPLRRGVHQRRASRLFTPSMAFAVNGPARLSLLPTLNGGLQLRRGRFRLTPPTVRLLPQTGLLTLGFDPARFQTVPPACYRASWQLPGRDSHPLATTSLCRIRSKPISSSHSGRTLFGAVNSVPGGGEV